MNRNIIYFIFALTFLLSSCCETNTQKIRIAISKEKSNSSNSKYSDWLLRHNNNIEWFNMYPMGIDSALNMMNEIDGLLLTGGEDVFPGNYGKLYDTARCGSFDRFRDSLEFALIRIALENNIPIFGVCRGEQILNISQGGTLYIDIPTDFDSTVDHRYPGYKRSVHPVWLVENTLISDVCGISNNMEVVSNHHQGIHKLGKGLKISAYSADSLPEAIEWNKTTDHPFLMAVQWHPEVMDTLHPLSAPLALKFINEAAKKSSQN